MSTQSPASEPAALSPDEVRTVATAEPVAPPPPAELRRPGLVLLLLCAAQFMIVLDFSITNVALPTIHTDLGFSTSALQWVVSAYALTFGGCLLLGGRISDLYGARRMFILGMFVFAGASLLAGFAQNASQLIMLRGAQGLAAALIAPAALALLTTAFPEGAARNRALGVWGAVLSLGFVAGVILGGVLTELLSWRWVFFINVPIGLATALASPALLARRENAAGHSGRKLDVPGAVTVTLALVGIVYALSVANVDGWVSWQSLGSFGGAVVLLVAFVQIENRTAEPLVPMSIFRLKALVVANLVNLALIASFVGTTYVLTLFLQTIQGYSPLRTGFTFSVLGLTATVAGLTAGKVAAKIGSRTAMVAGVGSEAIGTLLMATLPTGSSGLTVVLIGTALMGFGNILAIVMIIISATAGVPDDRQGLAGGLFNTSQQLGSALGVAAFAAIAVARTTSVLPKGVAIAAASSPELLSGYRLALLVCGLLAAFAGIVLLVTGRGKKAQVAAV